MAHPSTEIGRFRDRVTRFHDALRDLDEILAILEDHGTNDTERQAFFAPVFDAAQNYDITWSTFAAGVVGLRAIRTARDANKLAVAKLLQ